MRSIMNGSNLLLALLCSKIEILARFERATQYSKTFLRRLVRVLGHEGVTVTFLARTFVFATCSVVGKRECGACGALLTIRGLISRLIGKTVCYEIACVIWVSRGWPSRLRSEKGLVRVGAAAPMLWRREPRDPAPVALSVYG